MGETKSDQSTIINYFLRLLQESPNSTLCRFQSKGDYIDIDRQDFYSKSLNYTYQYKKMGLKPGDLIVIILDHRPDLLFSFFGAIFGGFIPSFMPPLTERQNPEHYWESHSKLFERIGIDLIVTFSENSENLKKHVLDFDKPVLSVEHLGSPGKEERVYQGLEEDIAFLQHSSGTTGLKKGVEIRHKELLFQVQVYAKHLKLSQSDWIVSWLPLYHDMGLIACFMLPIVLGIPFTMLDPFEWVRKPVTLLEVMESHGGTHSWIPNFAFNHIVKNYRGEKLNLKGVKALINCSEPCKAHSFEDFLKTFSDKGLSKEALQVCYAMAENVFAVTQTDIEKIPEVLEVEKGPFHEKGIILEGKGMTFLSCGLSLKETEVKIVDSERVDIGENRVGEVAISSPCLFKGYYKLEALTSEKISNSFYYTGDLGFIHDGHLYITGRKDDLLISYGKNVYSHLIEDVVNSVEGVHPGRNIAISAYNEKMGSSDLIVICEMKDENQGTIKLRVKQAVLDHLDVTLSKVVLVPKGWLIKTTSGKISRSANKEKYLSNKG